MEKGWALYIAGDRMSAELVVSHEAETDAETLRQAVAAAGITFGVIGGAVEKALAARGERVTVAAGNPPCAGRDAQLILHLDEAQLTGEALASVTDNLRRQVTVPSVEAGKMLAEVIPATPGTPGTNIFGESVPPPRPVEITLRALKGTSLSDDGRKVTAAITGRPRMERTKSSASFQVQPSFCHRGDVTVETGHLAFQGDITVTGNVIEGTSISATGSVEVLGNCVGTYITAGQNITVFGNVIQSRLSAGSSRLVSSRALPVLEEIVSRFAELLDVLDQLLAQPQLKKLPFVHIVRHVIETRYPEWPELVATLHGILREGRGYADQKFYSRLLACLDTQNWQGRENLSDAASCLLEARKALEEATAGGGDIHVSYALNSELHAGRKIVVRGQGCFLSQLEAGEEIHIHGKVRGGTLQAQTLLYAREVGSEAGAATILQVAPKGRIETDRCYENTLLYVGKSLHKVTDTTGRTKTAFDADARLVLVPRQ